MLTPYQREGEGYRCLRHAVVFAATESCAQCDDDPGPPLDMEVKEPLPDPPKGCLSTLQIERELGAELIAMRRHARALLDGRTNNARRKTKAKRKNPEAEAPLDPKTASAAAKLWDTYLKGARLLITLASRREDEEIVRRYQRREAARGAAH